MPLQNVLLHRTEDVSLLLRGWGAACRAGCRLSKVHASLQWRASAKALTPGRSESAVLQGWAGRPASFACAAQTHLLAAAPAGWQM